MDAMAVRTGGINASEDGLPAHSHVLSGRRRSMLDPASAAFHGLHGMSACF
jgi:hypothetical protein